MINEPKKIQHSYQGQNLLDFLSTVGNEPNDTLVVLNWMPYQPQEDGSWGPPMITLGRLREEFLLRNAYPHEGHVRIV